MLTEVNNARSHVQEWLVGERSYADHKWPPEMEDTILPSEYQDWVNQYIHRALILGLENPLGRQALAKALMTLTSFTESIVRRYGEIPTSGVPSGELTSSS